MDVPQFIPSCYFPKIYSLKVTSLICSPLQLGTKVNFLNSEKVACPVSIVAYYRTKCWQMIFICMLNIHICMLIHIWQVCLYLVLLTFYKYIFIYIFFTFYVSIFNTTDFIFSGSKRSRPKVKHIHVKI